MNTEKLYAHLRVRQVMGEALDALINALEVELSDDWWIDLEDLEEDYFPDPYVQHGAVGFLGLPVVKSDYEWAGTVIVEVHRSAEGDWSTKYRLHTGEVYADEIPVFDHAIDVVRAGMEQSPNAE